jgi:hypothetical protein
MAFFHLVATCQLSLADMPLTWLQAGEKYREWLVDQEGDEIKMIGCYKTTKVSPSRPWRGRIAYPGGTAQQSLHVGLYETQTECGHAVDDVRLRMGAGFSWWTEPMTKNDGTPSLTKGGKQRYTQHHILGADCDRNADISLNFYWRAHDRCHLEQQPRAVERTPPRGVHRAHTSNDICAAI